jgi:spermidine synthase
VLRGYLVLVQVAVLLAALLPALVLATTYYHVLPLGSASGLPLPSAGQASVEVLRLLAGAALVFVAAHQALARGRCFLESAASRQAEALDALQGRVVGVAILASAALSLFLELAVIRWLGELVPVFAFYKNYTLLACFAGLGLGYSLARQRQIPLLLSLPLLLLQAVALLVMRYGLQEWQLGSLWLTPFRERLNMGVGVASSAEHFVAIYGLLATVFLLTALAFVPVGQLCGRLLTREPDTLKAYGINLLGSLAGVALMMGASALWTPPPVWFGVACALVVAFQLLDVRVVLAGALAGLAIVVALAWPVTPGLERIHTPYQLLERGVGDHGWTSIKAAGHYYQRVLDLSRSNQNLAVDPDLAAKARYYDLVYQVLGRPPGRVAVVGAGMGNDVAAALRAGAAEVDAVEIDPAILALGAGYHPEHPYSDPRTHAIVDDARSFLRRTEHRYDVIVFGLLDSHTLLSHASSVRLDSFVYTVEAIREARRRLAPGGILSLAFAVLSPEMSAKIYGMLREAFDGRPPVCIYAGYEAAFLFLESRAGELTLDAQRLAALGVQDLAPRIAPHVAETDLATDDWPFLYMPRRVYPLSYVGMVVTALLLSYGLVRALHPAAVGRGGWAFFFLGAGFMLVETKAITELGLWFGNTWQVVGVTIAGVLVMGFLANAAIRALGARRWALWAALLVASLLAGFYVSLAGGLQPSAGGKLGTVVLVTLPVLFGGALFSTLLARFQDISAAMAMNLLGAMAGGLLEYNAMYFGYRSLYLLAAGLYLLAALGVAVRR